MACRGDPPITSWRASASTTLRNTRRHRGAQASLIMHLHSRRVLFTYNVLIAHLVSQHALISLYYCWDHLACPQSWAHPWAHPWAHLYARNTTRPPRVLKSAQSRALDLSDRHRQVWIAGLILKSPRTVVRDHTVHGTPGLANFRGGPAVRAWCCISLPSQASCLYIRWASCRSPSGIPRQTNSIYLTFSNISFLFLLHTIPGLPSAVESVISYHSQLS